MESSEGQTRGSLGKRDNSKIKKKQDNRSEKSNKGVGNLGWGKRDN